MHAHVCTNVYSILHERKKIIEAEVGVMVGEVPTQAVYLYSQSTSSMSTGDLYLKQAVYPTVRDRVIPLFSWC